MDADPIGPDGRSAEWELVHDPTGDFRTGARFTWNDVESGAHPISTCWEIGMTFQHVRNGTKYEVQRNCRSRSPARVCLVKVGDGGERIRRIRESWRKDDEGEWQRVTDELRGGPLTREELLDRLGWSINYLYRATRTLREDGVINVVTACQQKALWELAENPNQFGSGNEQA